MGWESHTRPVLGGRPQAIINQQIVESADFAVAVFGARIGTNTGVAVSGSVEEIDLLMARGVPVLVYFSGADIPRKQLDIKQYQALLDLRTRLQSEGLYSTFTDTADLRRQVALHIAGTVVNILQGDEGIETRATAPKPDIRVLVNNGMVFAPHTAKFRTISVQNHSPSEFFFKNVFFMMHERNILGATWQDHLGQDLTSKRKIASGDSLQASYYADRLFSELDPDKVKCIRVVDSIGRTFDSSEADWARVVMRVRSSE